MKPGEAGGLSSQLPYWGCTVTDGRSGREAAFALSTDSSLRPANAQGVTKSRIKFGISTFLLYLSSDSCSVLHVC